jgi:hypothetical protein
VRRTVRGENFTFWEVPARYYVSNSKRENEDFLEYSVLSQKIASYSDSGIV